MFRGEQGNKTPPGAEFQEILQGLDLEQCTVERNLLTGEVGWHAPVDYVFEVTGEFVITQDVPHVSYESWPIDSWDLILKGNERKYKRYLEEAEGDEQEAKGFLIESISEGLGYYVDSFAGKWLVIAPNIDGTKTDLIYPHEPSVMIKEDPHIWYETGFFDHRQIGNNRYHFNSSLGTPMWLQQFVELSSQYSQNVRLVYREDPKLELYIPDKQPEMKIEVPGIEYIPVEFVLPQERKILKLGEEKTATIKDDIEF